MAVPGQAELACSLNGGSVVWDASAEVCSLATRLDEILGLSH